VNVEQSEYPIPVNHESNFENVPLSPHFIVLGILLTIASIGYISIRMKKELQQVRLTVENAIYCSSTGISSCADTASVLLVGVWFIVSSFLHVSYCSNATVDPGQTTDRKGRRRTYRY